MKKFATVGYGAREVALLLGGLGELRRVVQETQKAEASRNKGDEDDEPLDPEFEQLVPTTFGSPDKKYGAKMGKADFGTTYLSRLLKSNGDADDPLRLVLLGNSNVLEFVKKYAKNEVSFISELQELYQRMTVLGEAYSTRNS